jgi:hypothetical protein
VLTGDLVGAGAQKLDLAAWFADGEAEMLGGVEKRRARIRAQNGVRHVGFDKNDPLAPTPDVAAEIAKSAHGQADVSFARLPAVWQRYLRQEAAYQAEHFSRSVHQGSLLLSETLNFAFVLPNGAAVEDASLAPSPRSRRDGNRAVAVRDRGRRRPACACPPPLLTGPCAWPQPAKAKPSAPPWGSKTPRLH